MTNPAKYKWCKCYYEPTEEGAQDYYYMHIDTRASKWEEPEEPYWVWDAQTNAYHASGLQIPESLKSKSISLACARGKPANTTTTTEAHENATKPPSSEPDPNYQGYNPKIHGNYDPNAPYAKFHEQKRDDEKLAKGYVDAKGAQDLANAGYAVAGNFNRFSGGFQSEDKTADRHNDFNKSGRQMGAYFDVDAAANQHDGRSLKEERRSQKLSKKEIKELTAKRREKKEKKRMDFYKS